LYEIVKYFFLADILFLGGHFDLDKYIFPWQMCFIWGCHLRLESSCIQVNTVSNQSTILVHQLATLLSWCVVDHALQDQQFYVN